MLLWTVSTSYCSSSSCLDLHFHVIFGFVTMNTFRASRIFYSPLCKIFFLSSYNRILSWLLEWTPIARFQPHVKFRSVKKIKKID